MKNQTDLEYFMGAAADYGWSYTDNPDNSDVIIINTCAFIHDAREESLEAIFETLQNKPVIVTGCLPQRYGEELRKALPEVTVFAGTEFSAFMKDIDSAFREGRSILKTTERKTYRESAARKPIDRFHTYIKLSEGCSRKCAYCAIPMIRGRYRSRSMQAIIREVENLYRKGFREFNLISEDSSLYGIDTTGSRKLISLMEKLDRLGLNNAHFRLLYMYPDRIAEEAAAMISESRHFIRYMDMPVQHVSAKVLRAMGRNVFNPDELFSRLRQKGIVIRSTLMTGFPGEGIREFRELEHFVAKGYIDKLGVFPYSPEEGTLAYSLNSPRASTAVKRAEKLMSLQDEIADDKMRSKIGTVQQAVIYSTENGHSTGRLIEDLYETDNELWIENVDKSVFFKEIKVKITDIDGPLYIGRMKY